MQGQFAELSQVAYCARQGPQPVVGNIEVFKRLKQQIRIPLATGERVVLIEGGRDARYVETGHLVYALNGVVTAVAFDLDARDVPSDCMTNRRSSCSRWPRNQR